MCFRNWLVRSVIVLGVVCALVGATLPAAPRAWAAENVVDAGDEAWDNRFGLPGIQDSAVEAMAVAANGDIFVAGRFTEAGNRTVNQVARWDGEQFHPLGEGLKGGAPYVLVADGDDLYAVGSFTSAGYESANGIARWDGAAWSPVGTGEGAKGPYGDSYGVWLRAAAIYDGKLIIAGEFRSVDGVPAMNIAAWDGANWSPLGGGVHGPADYSIAEVRTLLTAGGLLYAGGEFELADGVWSEINGELVPEQAVTVNSIAAWDGAAWSPVGGGVSLVDGSTQPGKVMALAYGANKLYAGGYFNRAGGKTVNYVAQFDGAAWSGLSSGVRPVEFSTDAPIDALAYADNMLYVGGSFTAAGGKNIDLLASWDGAAWNEVAGGIDNEGYDRVYSLAIAPGGLVAGGLFRVMRDTMVNNVALLSDGAWQALGQGVSTDYGDMPGKPYALASDDAGNVYLGGEFTRLGGVAARNIGRWDGAAWHSLGDADSYVAALAIGGGYLYAGGNFTQIGGVAAAHVARMNLQTGQWSALGSGINGSVNALVYSDGILYAGGAFKAAGNVTAEDVAYWDGAAWHSFGNKYRIFEVGDQGGEVGTYVNALAVAGDSVYIGGHFQTIQFGTNTADLSTFVVVHNVVEWNAATDQWAFVGAPQKPGVTSGGFSGFGTDVYALAVVGNSLFIGGSFNQAGDLAASGGLGRWDRAARTWVSIEGSLGGLGDAHVRGLAAAGADLLVAGKFTSAGASASRYVARFDTATNGWVGMGSGLRWYNDIYTKANVVLAAPGGVYVGGDFDQAGGHGSLGFARWIGALNAPNLTPNQGAVLEDDGVSATFPAGAVAEPGFAVLDRTGQAAAALPDGWAGLYGMRVGITTLSGKQLGQTVQPYTVRASFTDAQLAAAQIDNAADLRLMAWDGAAWQPISTCGGCGVDLQTKTVTGATDRLLPLALAGPVGGEQGESNYLYLPAIQR
jgi:hypothetical protein